MELAKPKTVKIKYSEISSFEFNTAMQKIAATPVDNKTACSIRRVVKAVSKGLEDIRLEYKTKFIDVWGKKDAEGKIIPPADGNPSGFEVPDEKADEFMKAQEDFGKSELELSIDPLTPNDLKDIRLSAKELDCLRDLFLDA